MKRLLCAMCCVLLVVVSCSGGQRETNAEPDLKAIKAMLEEITDDYAGSLGLNLQDHL